jgi:hypothetical protein
MLKTRINSMTRGQVFVLLLSLLYGLTFLIGVAVFTLLTRLVFG